MNRNLSTYSHVFLIGIGGIGMSGLARYFKLSGMSVSGYDRNASPITCELEKLGINVYYDSSFASTEASFAGSGDMFVVYTAAISFENEYLQFFQKNNYRILKRADVLDMVVNDFKTIAIAGTHGKTTVSTMLSHILFSSAVGCNAFLGGIAKNYDSNFLHHTDSEYAVTEADEFDRSFLKLHPHMGAITSIDADHLDIYNTYDELLEAFNEFATRFDTKGTLIVKNGLPVHMDFAGAPKMLSYALDDTSADVYATNIHVSPDHADFDLVMGERRISNCRLGITGIMNVENAVVASCLALLAGVTETELKEGLKSFAGIRRRFDLRFQSDTMVYIDDYAHHPEEINALVRSVRAVYPGRRITAVFQPHLFSRTRDFAVGFANSLSKLDEVILLNIYPAREQPIPGVTSQIIYDKIPISEKEICKKEEVVDMISGRSMDLLLTIGAGDIDTLVPKIVSVLNKKYKL